MHFDNKMRVLVCSYFYEGGLKSTYLSKKNRGLRLLSFLKKVALKKFQSQVVCPISLLRDEISQENSIIKIGFRKCFFSSVLKIKGRSSAVYSNCLESSQRRNDRSSWSD